jgi:hypothetical protein
MALSAGERQKRYIKRVAAVDALAARVAELEAGQARLCRRCAAISLNAA